MDGVDIKDLTTEQYLELTQENHAPSVGIKVDDIIIAEYLEYEETIKTQDYDDYQPHSDKADGSNNKAIILGRPFLANIRAEIYVSSREFSLRIEEDKDELSYGVGVSRDKDDLEGIIDYLEPTLYDGFINHNDEAYKQRRNKLLEMRYTKPPPIGIKSLWEDGDNLKDFLQISNLKAMLKEFLFSGEMQESNKKQGKKDSNIAEAAKGIAAWFPGTLLERFLLEEQLEISDRFRNDKANALRWNTNREPVSFGDHTTLGTKHAKKKENFIRLLENSKRIADSDLVFPMSTIEEAHNMYANSLYGYFVGKCLVFPIVENYVNNMWAKFVFQKLMMNVDGFFFLKFAARAGLEQVISFARALIEISSDRELEEELVVAIPVLDEPEVVAIDNQDDGFIEVTRKNNKGKKADKSLSRHIDVLKLNKLKPNYFYHPKEKKSHDKETNKDDEMNIVKLKNHLDALSQQEAIFSETSGGETSSGNGATNKHDKAYNETNIPITSATNSKWQEPHKERP
ncbi:hypothetical protein Tco_1517561 [Tanacetum coccineum]